MPTKEAFKTGQLNNMMFRRMLQMTRDAAIIVSQPLHWS